LSLGDLASLGSFVSGLAVLVSLIFLYFQLRQINVQVRQAEKTQQATARQERTGRMVAMTMLVASEPALAAALERARAGAEDLSDAELTQCVYYAMAMFGSLQDSFFQHRDGLMTDFDFAAVEEMARRICRYTMNRLLWKRVRTSVGPEFNAYMDALMAETEVVPNIADGGAAAWLRELAEEQARIRDPRLHGDPRLRADGLVAPRATVDA
jgi:hypothetical protein